MVALAGSSGAAFYGLALLAFAINRFILSALSASLPGVTADLLVAGNALSTTSGTLATVVLGPRSGPGSRPAPPRPAQGTTGDRRSPPCSPPAPTW